MYLLTSAGRVLSQGRGVSLSQLLPEAANRPLFLEVEIKDGLVEGGPLHGCALSITPSGDVQILKAAKYLTAAPGWEKIEEDRDTPSAWETFRPASAATIDAMCADEAGPRSPGSVVAPCTKIWGADRHVHANPSIVTVQDCFYLPASKSASWGVYGTDGEPLYDAMSGRQIYNMKLETDLTTDSVMSVAPDHEYVYGGVVNCHFGHFLVDTLPRLWAISQYKARGLKILCHAEDTPERWFSFPYIASILGAIGLGPEDFVTFTEPVRIGTLIIPKTSMAPQQVVHDAFGELGRKIGRTLVPEVVAEDDRPIYYSRTQLTVGTYRLVNEVVLEDALRARGVRIVYPEHLSFTDQLKIMMGSKRIIATSGSYLHTSLFCSPRRMTVLTNDGALNANFLLIDKVTGSRVRYVDPVEIERVDPPAGFGNAARLKRPGDVGAALYKMAMDDR